jgi:hypothetical protein
MATSSPLNTSILRRVTSETQSPATGHRPGNWSQPLCDGGPLLRGHPPRFAGRHWGLIHRSRSRGRRAGGDGPHHRLASAPAANDPPGRPNPHDLASSVYADPVPTNPCCPTQGSGRGYRMAGRRASLGNGDLAARPGPPEFDRATGRSSPCGGLVSALPRPKRSRRGSGGAADPTLGGPADRSVVCRRASPAPTP